MLRTWTEYAMVCAQQVEIHRLAYSIEVIAASANTIDNKPLGEFCFGCSKQQDPKRCSVSVAIIAAHLEYYKVLMAIRTHAMRIQQNGHSITS